jgi:hypothetical protein
LSDRAQAVGGADAPVVSQRTSEIRCCSVKMLEPEGRRLVAAMLATPRPRLLLTDHQALAQLASKGTEVVRCAHG